MLKTICNIKEIKNDVGLTSYIKFKFDDKIQFL